MRYSNITNFINQNLLDKTITWLNAVQKLILLMFHPTNGKPKSSEF